MRRVGRISLSARRYGADVIASLQASFANGVASKRSFVFESDVDDQIHNVVRAAEALGLVSVASGQVPRRENGEFRVRWSRYYDDADFDAAEWFSLRIPMLDEASRESLWFLEEPVIDGSSVTLDRGADRPPKNIELLVANASHWAIKKKNAEALQLKDLKHLDFAPIDWPGLQSKWCLVYSRVVLPPMAPSMRLIDRNGDEVSPGYAGAVAIKDHVDYDHAEFHYERADIETAGPFDIARTFEYGAKDENAVVVSKRFVEECAILGILLPWVPVRVS